MGETRLDEGADCIQFLPGSKEGLFDFVEFGCEFVDDCGQVGGLSIYVR